MKKGLVFLTTLAALTLGLAACGGGGGGDTTTYEVKITNKEALAEIWDDDNSKSVSVSIEGVIVADAYNEGDLVVTSGNDAVLTIAGNNKIRPVAAGETTVKATYKNKFSDEVTIKIKARPALRPTKALLETDEYYLATPLSTGRVYIQDKMAGGSAKFYISGTENMDNAAKATVKVNAAATDDYKYEITVKSADATEGKVLGVASNGEGTNKHYNLGFVGDNVPDTDIPYAKGLFRFTEDYHLEVKVDDKVMRVGTGKGKTTISLGEVGTDKVVESYMYIMGEPIPATAIAVSPETLSVAAGATGQLTATLTPAESSDIVKWYTDNKEVATVDAATGVVTGVAEGTAHITAEARANVKQTVTVTVTAALNYGTEAEPLTTAEAKKLLDNFDNNTLTPQEIYVKGEVKSKKYNTTYKNWEIWLDGTTKEDGFELYATSLADGVDESLLQVGAQAKAHGLGKIYNGTYELCNNGSLSHPWVYSLEYTRPALESITLPETGEIFVDATLALEATLLPAGAAMENPVWESDTPTVATVENGVVTGVAAGTAKIKVTDGAIVSNECIVTVKAGADPKWESTYNVITVDQAIALMPETGGASTTEEYYVIGKVGGTINTTYGNCLLLPREGDAELTIYGMYNHDGTVRYDAMTTKPVKDDVVVLCGKIKNYVKNEVSTPEIENAKLVQLNGEDLVKELTGITLPETAEVIAGKTTTLTVTAVPAGASLGTVTWASDNEAVATVANGVVAGVAAGTAHITATAGAFSARCTVTVTENTTGELEKTIALANNKFTLEGKIATYVTEGFTFTMNQNSSTSSINTEVANHLRVYKNHTFAVENNDVSITKVELTVTDSSYANLDNITSLLPDGAEATLEGLVFTITLPANSSSFSFIAGNQVRLTQAKITYIPSK